MSFPNDYAERVYAGVLGKIIGVYLGRPFEGWTYAEIMAKLGEVTYYVNDRIGQFYLERWGSYFDPPLIVTDDDITGTFTFLHALPDYGNSPDLTPAQIGQSWLNYIIENRTILWWGGMGNSTEHTAYLRLKRGMPAPQSGSIATNGTIVAEQIGSQIFIDGWAMVAPGDPEFAADLARRAASVSHDGEAIYGAQVLAAMESQAFVESRIDTLLDIGTSLIPKTSTIYRLINDLRAWHAAEPDWHKTLQKIQGQYGYDRYGGAVHIIPNHALVILGLLYSNDDFQTAMKVVNTAGWDTDCNSGNLGCLMGIKNGLAGLHAGPDWRGPVEDRILMPTAEGGRAVSDAVNESLAIINIARALKQEPPYLPKGGARFNFAFPGSVQGFRAGEEGTVLENVAGHSREGQRALALRFQTIGSAATPTFIMPDELQMRGYSFIASPTIYTGQTVRAGVSAETFMNARLFVRVYDNDAQLNTVYGPQVSLEPNQSSELIWQIPDSGGQPIAQVGIEGHAESAVTLYLDYLTWDGEPDIVLARPADEGSSSPKGTRVWRQAWIDGLDEWEKWSDVAYKVTQNDGIGLLIQGTREWHNYEVEATVELTLAKAAGIGVRVQGMRRYYALLLANDGKAHLVKALDGLQNLAKTDFPWEIGKPYTLRLQANDRLLRAWIDGQLLFEVQDNDQPLAGGAAAFILEEGHMMSNALTVRPLKE